jgi:hypothetical protein
VTGIQADKPRKIRKRIVPAWWVSAFAMIDYGDSVIAVARAVGKSANAVRYAITARYGAPKPSQKPPPDPRRHMQEARRLAARHMPLTHIAAQLRVPYGALLEMLKD